jgi:hypothetical protein
MSVRSNQVNDRTVRGASHRRRRRRHPRLTIAFALLVADGLLWCSRRIWRQSPAPIHDVSAVNFRLGSIASKHLSPLSNQCGHDTTRARREVPLPEVAPHSPAPLEMPESGNSTGSAPAVARSLSASIVFVICYYALDQSTLNVFDVDQSWVTWSYLHALIA